MTNSEYSDKIARTVANYKKMEERDLNSSMLSEIRWQYLDMSRGGDGGTAGTNLPGEGTIRSEHYPGIPNRFFLEVINLMGWFPNGLPAIHFNSHIK